MSRKSFANKQLNETDLYGPIKEWLSDQGYEVRGEVNHCDITAFKENDLVVVELKKSLNLEVILQAVDRQKACDSVYIAVPGPLKTRPASRGRKLRHLLRRLELGLVTVDFQMSSPSPTIICHPEPYQRKRNLKRKRVMLEEAVRRSGDFNRGGSVGKKLMTVYRENAVYIACCLAEFGPLSTARIRDLGGGPKTQSILYNNHYNWFQRVERGVYRLTAQGAEDLGRYPELKNKFCHDIMDAAATP